MGFKGISLCLTLGLFASIAQANVQRFKIVQGNLATRIEVLGDKLIHVEIGTLTEEGSPTDPLTTTPMVLKKNFSGPTKILTTNGGFETSHLKVTPDDKTLCINFYDKLRQASLTTICPSLTSGLSRLTLSQESMENVYGLGEEFIKPGEPNGDWVGRQRTPGTKFGNALIDFQGGVIGNAQFPIMYAVGPQHLNYALFVDHTPAQTWNFKSNPWYMETTGTPLRYYFFSGSDLPSLRADYMELVGRPPVPPKKTLGLWVSEFGYNDWQEMEGKLKTLRQHHFPVDGFVLDVYWFGSFRNDTEENNFGHVAFDEVHFPNPAQEMDYLKRSEGIGIATIEDSYVNYNLDEFKWLANQNYFVKTLSNGSPLILKSWWGKGGMIDWSSSKASAAWHDYRRQKIIDDGVMIHWTDLGEPETHSDQALYSGVEGVFGNGEAQLHNLYSFKWSESIADGYLRHKVERRPFILSRSGTSGIQRFGDALWSGDIGSNLKSLQAHLNAQMHMSFSGIDYFGCDVGGFHREALEGDLNEMYTRWFAHSALFDFPVRPHTDNGSKKNNTPPDRVGDLASNLFNIRQRYELSPYYYSLTYRAYLYGEPVLPPPVFYYQDEKPLRTLGDEKMIGPFVLVATAAKEGEQERSVYLPQGHWTDLHTLKTYQSAGTWVDHIPEFQSGVFRLPIFVRDGAIIPKMKVDDRTMNILGKRTDRSSDSDLRLLVTPSQTSSTFTLYEDDGETVKYKKGAYAATLIRQVADRKNISVEVGKSVGFYHGQPSARRVWIDFYVSGAQISGALVDGTALTKVNSLKQLETASQGWLIADANHIIVKTDSAAVSSSRSIQLAKMKVRR